MVIRYCRWRCEKRRKRKGGRAQARKADAEAEAEDFFLSKKVELCESSSLNK